jgi:hypothetical protein
MTVGRLQNICDDPHVALAGVRALRMDPGCRTPRWARSATVSAELSSSRHEKRHLLAITLV